MQDKQNLRHKQEMEDGNVHNQWEINYPHVVNAHSLSRLHRQNIAEMDSQTNKTANRISA